MSKGGRTTRSKNRRHCLGCAQYYTRVGYQRIPKTTPTGRTRSLCGLDSAFRCCVFVVCVTKLIGIRIQAEVGQYIQSPAVAKMRLNARRLRMQLHVYIIINLSCSAEQLIILPPQLFHFNRCIKCVQMRRRSLSRLVKHSS